MGSSSSAEQPKSQSARPPSQQESKQHKPSKVPGQIHEFSPSPQEAAKPHKQINLPTKQQSKDSSEAPPVGSRQRYTGDGVPDLIIQKHQDKNHEHLAKHSPKIKQKHSLQSIPNTQRTNAEENLSSEAFFHNINQNDRKARTHRNNHIEIEEINSEFDDQVQEKVTKRRQRKYRVNRM